MRLAILGFGLIGGSVARALRRTGASLPDGRPIEVTAWSRRPDGPRAALGEGIVNRAAGSLDEAIEGADVVLLAAPPLAVLDLLTDLAAPGSVLLASATVTDVTSTKAAIGRRAAELGLRFVGGHPMAGREASGYAAASAELFLDRPWVVCPGGPAGSPLADPADVARVEALALACGARPVRLDPAEHDAAVAAISHLPLVLSAALVEAVVGGPAWPTAATLAASGWRDMTRLARGDPWMGAGIASTNAVELAARVRDLRAVLDRWLAELDRPEPDDGALAERLAAVRRSLEAG